ncbi:MAG: ABC transporter ATP-binding protein [Chloroflexota bacterium]
MVTETISKKSREFELPQKNPLSILSYLGKYKRQFWLQAAGGILYNTVIVSGPILLGLTVDAAAALLNEGHSLERVRTLFLYCALFVLLTIFFQYARYVKRWYIRDMCNRIACDIRAGLFRTILTYPMQQLDQESVGDLMSRTVGDVEQFVTTVQTTINEGWDTWLLMVSYFVVLLFYDYRITLICSIPIPIVVYAAELVRHPVYRFSLNARRTASVVTSHLQKTLNGLTILRLFGRESVEKERLKNYSRNQMGWEIKSNMLETGMRPVYMSLASLGIIGVIGLGGKNVIDGSWTIGYFIAYLAMFTAMSRRTQVAARVLNRFHAASAAWDRIREKIREATGSTNPEPVEEVKEQRRPLTDLSAPAYIQVENLSFGYTSNNHTVLQEISFTVARGDFVGVTGPVGSGKSTLALLLTGLYPYSGRIVIGGRDLADLSPVEKPGALAYSGQDAFLFSASIARNITFQETSVLSTAEMSRLNRAIYISALSEDMELFPDGLDTLVGERGIRVSGGQRQRIALARAIFTGNPILILDDPFSAVDIGTEKRIIDRIKENLKGTTILVFSHRLAAFTTADRVLVLDKGRLVETGSHEELMALSGIYQKIYAAQSWLQGDGDE